MVRMIGAAAASLCLALGASFSGAAADAAQLPSEQLQELDEILVHGQRLARRIEDAEDEFYKLYNALTRDEDYRMYCGQRSLEAGSRIMVRVCVPGFVANYLPPPRISWGMCNGEFNVNGRIETPGPCIDGGYEPPPASLVVMARSPELARHMTAVIRSDPRLQQKAAHLDDLYLELNTVKNRFAGFRQAGRSGGKVPGSKLHPRAL
jgi:hypothetical protein